MFYTILVPPECAYDEPPTNGLECRSAEYYLQTYSILLGDFGNFDRAVFTTAFSVILIVLFSFMVVIVLLNVLIAIVSDSYEKCLIRSKMLFGRARVMLIAELASFQNLLRKDTRKEGDAPESIYSQWWYGTFGSGNQRWSRGSVVFFLLSALVVLVWFIAETVGYFRGRRIGNYIFSLCSILVNVILYCFIVAMLSSGASSANNGTGSRRVLQGGGCVGFIWCVFAWPYCICHSHLTMSHSICFHRSCSGNGIMTSSKCPCSDCWAPTKTTLTFSARGTTTTKKLTIGVDESTTFNAKWLALQKNPRCK